MLLVNKILVRIIILIRVGFFFYNAMHLRNLLYLNRYYIAHFIQNQTHAHANSRTVLCHTRRLKERNKKYTLPKLKKTTTTTNNSVLIIVP